MLLRADTIRSMILGMALIACPAEVYAQARTSYYTSLHDALVEFQNQWGVDLAYDAELVDNRWTAWSKPQGVTAEDDLAVLLIDTGIVFKRLESGTWSLVSATTRRGTISGLVMDAFTGRPLREASVQIAGTQYGTATDSLGRFTLSNVLSGLVLLKFSFVGYAVRLDSLVLVPGGHSTLEAALTVEEIEHAPIEVWDVRFSGALQLRKLNVVRGMRLAEVGGVGTADTWRSVARRVPGLAINEQSADFHIQGGDTGEHQFKLDGSPVFYPVFVSGIISGFNAFALDNVEVHKAGFGVSQGSYLSGVVLAKHAAVDTTDSPLDMYLDPLSFSARVNVSTGRSSKTRGTLMAALRRSLWKSWWSGTRSSNIDQLMLNFSEPDIFLSRASLYPLKRLRPDLYKAYTDRLSHIPPPSLPDVVFSDLHIAGQLLRSQSWLRGSYYRSGNELHGRHLIASLLEDDESIPRPDAYNWINESGQLTWTFSLSSDMLMTTRLRGSRYQLNHKYAGLDRDDAYVLPFGNRLFIELTPAEDGNRIRELGLEHVVEHSHGIGSLAASLAYVLSSHRFVVRDIFPQGIRHERTTANLALYLEEVINATESLKITGGTRLTYPQTRRTAYAEPRLSLETKLRTGRRGAIATRLAAGLYYQFLNQFDVSTISPSTLISSKRVWLPVDESLAPAKSYHFAADLGVDFLKYWALRTESYYKRQSRVLRIDYPRLWQPEDEDTFGSDVEEITAQSGFVAPSKGFAYGTALVLERKSRHLRLHTRYEYSIAEREHTFRGGTVRRVLVPWSEPQRLHLEAEAALFGRIRTSARWRGIWGRVWGFRQAYYDFLASDTDQGLTFGGIDFREPTSKQHRLTPMKQLDLGLAYHANARQSLIQIRVDLLNTFNRSNETELFLKEVSGPGDNQLPQDEPDLIIQRKHLIGRTLSFSFRLLW